MCCGQQSGSPRGRWRAGSHGSVGAVSSIRPWATCHNGSSHIMEFTKIDDCFGKEKDLVFKLNGISSPCCPDSIRRAAGVYYRACTRAKHPRVSLSSRHHGQRAARHAQGWTSLLRFRVADHSRFRPDGRQTKVAPRARSLTKRYPKGRLAQGLVLRHCQNGTRRGSG